MLSILESASVLIPLSIKVFARIGFPQITFVTGIISMFLDLYSDFNNVVL